MKFSSRPNYRSNGRRRAVSSAPANVDTLEARLLLTTPDLLTPTGVVGDPTPLFTWEAVDTAVDYDLWVTSLETFETVLVERGIVGTSYTPAEGTLAQGRIRVWVNANLSGGGTSGWSPAAEAIIQAPATLTGPMGVGGRNLIGDNTPEITWDSAVAARRFQIWVTNLSEKARLEEEAAAAGSTDPIDVSLYATVYTVENYELLKDENGDNVLDAFGNPIHDEVRSFILPQDSSLTGSADITVDPASAIDTVADSITWTDHGLTTGSVVHYDAGGGTPIGGLADDTDYFVISVDANTIQLAATAQDSLSRTAVDLTDIGAGTLHRFSVVNPERILNTGRYRLWMRTVDLSGRVSSWSAPLTFDQGSAPENLTPAAPSFQDSPEFRWDTVAGATHYELFVARVGGPSPFFRRTIPAATGVLKQSGYIIQSTTGAPIVDDNDGVVELGETARLDADGNEIRYNIEPGDYTWWVRAVNMGAAGSRIPVVYGTWSAATDFSTIEGPVVTAPVPDSGFVTSARPTITWTEIHGAARYQVLIYRFDARPPFIDVQSTTTSYTLTEDIPAGEYTIWVRGIDTRGDFSPWSAGYAITATGGRPVVTAIGAADPFWTFSWIGVPEAVSYEIWVSQEGVDFTFINVDSIAGTTYDPGIPFNTGAHRVWVRAMKADGTAGPWSLPVAFTVAAADERATVEENDSQLAAVRIELSPETDGDAVPVSEARMPVPAVDAPHEARTEIVEPVASESAEPPVDAQPAEVPQLPADILTTLAEQCTDTEWWGLNQESV